MFDDISNLRLTLGPKDHILYTAFYLYLNGYKTIDPKRIPINEIKKVIYDLINIVSTFNCHKDYIIRWME